MELLRRSLQAPSSGLVFKMAKMLLNTSAPEIIVKQIQLLPVIRACPEHPKGKIQLCKWRGGIYDGRYTGIISTVPPENEFDADVDASTNASILRNLATDLLPTQLKQHLSHVSMCADLMFDGPPETQEFVFIANLRGHSIEPVDWENLTYIPEWFDLDNIPYSDMPEDDFHWYPKALSGKKLKGSFVFGGLSELTIKSFHLEEVDEF